MVFGKLVSGSEKNEQTRQVADIRSRVLKEECGLKIEAEPEAFCMYALAYEGDTPVATGEITFDGESYRIQEVAVLPEFRRKIWRFYCAAADRQGDAVRGTDD